MKSIIVLLNYHEFPSQKLITSDAITAFLSRPAVINTPLNAQRSQRKAISLVETNATPLLIG